MDSLKWGLEKNRPKRGFTKKILPRGVGQRICQKSIKISLCADISEGRFQKIWQCMIRRVQEKNHAFEGGAGPEKKYHTPD